MEAHRCAVAYFVYEVVQLDLAWVLLGAVEYEAHVCDVVEERQVLNQALLET